MTRSVGVPARRVAGELLSRRLEQARDDGGTDLHLREEMLVMRVLRDEALDDYGRALDMLAVVEASPEVGDKERKLARDILSDSRDRLVGVLSEVRDMVADAARVEAMTGDRFSGRAVREILTGAVRMLGDICGPDDRGIVEEFNKRLDERSPVDAGGAAGTVLTPDMDAAEMDATVPRV